MDTKIKPQEPMVIIPIGMDCRGKLPSIPLNMTFTKPEDNGSYAMMFYADERIQEDADNE